MGRARQAMTDAVMRRAAPLRGVQRRAKARGHEGEPFDPDRDRTGEGHECVNRAVETAVFDRNARCSQPIGVRLPFVVQRIAAGGHDECRRQPGQIAAEQGRGAQARSRAAARR